MNRLKDKFFSYITAKEGFYVEFYISQYRNTQMTIALKRFPQGIYAIILTDDKYENIDYNEALYYLKQKGEGFSLHTIVFTSESIYNPSYSIDNKVVVDYSSGKILYCDQGCEPIVGIIRNVTGNDEKIVSEFKRYYITYTLIIVNVALFIICALKSRNIFDINPYVLLEMGAKYRPLMYFTNEWWRLISCNFLHGGIVHLAFNMYALYIIGKQIEDLYGKKAYIIIYSLSGLGGSILSYYLAPTSLSVGASGAIFGLLSALLVYAYKERGRIQKGALSNLLFVIGINLLFGLSMPNIDNYGHIGGIVVGAISSYLIYIILKRQGKVV